MKLATNMLAVAVLLVATQSAMAQSAVDSSITYQGYLEDNGVPVTGQFDFVFTLFVSATGPGDVGTTSINDVEVEDGKFTVQLDFDVDVFTQFSKRWLQIDVDGDTLFPRQEITAAPYATATRGLYVADDESFIGIGRVFSVNDDEVFGVNAENGPFAFGGMYLRTNDLGKPFYGYQTGNSVSARHYFDGKNRTWKLDNGGTQLSVDDSGGFGAADTGSGFFNLNVFPNGDTKIGNISALNYSLNVMENGFVGIGRDTPVVDDAQGQSWFDVQIPASSDNVGGMYLENASAGKRTVYGFAADGESKAVMSYDDQFNTWALDIGPSVADELVVKGNTGRVGISTFNPEYTLHVSGSAGKPNGGPFSATSDRRLKKNIKELNGTLNKLMKLRGVTFEYKDPKAINELAGIHVGLIAQEVEKVFPQWVNERSDGFKTVGPYGFEALTVEALRELRNEKDEQIQELQDENDELRQRLETLEATVTNLSAAK